MSRRNRAGEHLNKVGYIFAGERRWTEGDLGGCHNLRMWVVFLGPLAFLFVLVLFIPSFMSGISSTWIASTG